MEDFKIGDTAYLIVMLLTYAVLIGMILYVIDISKNFNVEKDYDILIQKIISHPELKDYRTGEIKFGFRKIELNGTVEQLTGKRFSNEYLGYYLVRFEDVYVIYDLNMDRIVEIYK